MLKIKNKNHFETAEEIINEILDKIQKLAAEAEAFAHGTNTAEEKADGLRYKQTEIAALSNFLNNDLGYEIRLDDGTLFTSFYFNRVFYFRQMAEIEASRVKQAEEAAK